MSSQKVTLSELIAKWKESTTQDSETRWDEMNAFFSEAAESGITQQEILRRKDSVIRIWCPLTWQEAQKEHESWKQKDWWDRKKKATLKTFDKWYSEYYGKTKKQTEEPEAKVQQSRPALKVVGESGSFEDDYYSQFKPIKDGKAAKEHRKKMEELERKGGDR